MTRPLLVASNDNSPARAGRKISAAYLRARVSYDPDSGEFRYRRHDGACDAWNANCAGQIATTMDEDGYLVIVVDRTALAAHRAAWAIMTGKWPHLLIDHKDRVKTNNRWENLREATPSQNAANRTIRNDNTSGFKGVSYKKQTGRWVARAHINGKAIHIGYFDSAEEAAHAYLAKSTELHGEFATDGKAHAALLMQPNPPQKYN